MSAAGVRIRELSGRDVAAATALGRRSFEAAAEQPDFADELVRTIARTWVAERDGVILGYALGWVAADEAQLMSIAVEPAARGLGVGRALLARFLEAMPEEGVHTIVLEVRVSNAAARRLYEAAGFVPVGSRRRYYADGEDAVTYRRDHRPDLALGS